MIAYITTEGQVDYFNVLDNGNHQKFVIGQDDGVALMRAAIDCLTLLCRRKTNLKGNPPQCQPSQTRSST